MTEFISTILVGVNQALIGMPFDTITVWMQNNQPIFNRPFRHYYRGFGPEFCNSIITNSIVFPIYSYSSSNYTTNAFLSGGFAGACASPIIYTFRSFKIFQQVGKPFNINRFINYKGRGYLSTLMRESIGYGLYFGSYSYLKDQGAPTFIAGGFAGLCNWGLSFPIDTVVSRQIAQNIPISQAIKMGGLYRGYGVCLLRAILVNSFNFLVYENVNSIFA